MSQYSPGLGTPTTFQMSTVKLGSPIVADYFTNGSPGTQLSATTSTEIDFSQVMGGPIDVPGIVLDCGYSVVDGSTGNVVDYGATVSEIGPDVSYGITNGHTRYRLRLQFPPTTGAPYVNIHVFITYLPFVTAPNSF